MGDKDTPLFDGKNRTLTFYDVSNGAPISYRIIADSLAYEVSMAEDSVEISTSSDGHTDSIPMNKMSFSVDVEGNVSEIFAVPQPIIRAQEMLNTIKEELTLFYHQNPPRNRKERRERGREIKRHIERFNRYCRKNHVVLKNKP